MRQELSKTFGDTAAVFISQGLIQLTTGAAGATLGGIQGAQWATAVDVNNRQLHPKEVRFLRDKERVKRYAEYMSEKAGKTLSLEDAGRDLDRYGAAMADSKWSQINGRDANTEAFIKAEAENAKLSYLDNNGDRHLGFSVTREEYSNEFINLKALFDEYKPSNDVAKFLNSNLNQADQVNSQQRFREGQQAGYKAAGEEANIASDAWGVVKGVVQLPGHVIDSIKSDEVGPIDSQRMQSKYQALLKIQGRYEEAGFIYEKDWATTQRMMLVGLPMSELGLAGLGKLSGVAKGLSGGAGKVEADALSAAKVEINANTDASFAGGVPVRPRDGQVPAGTAQVDTPIGKHLIEAEIKNYKGQPTAISGGHNMDNFNQALQANGGQVIGTPKEVASGIYQVEYRLPGTVGKNEFKTIYDPAKYSDQQMASMANEAVSRGIYQWNKSGMGKVPDVQFVDVGGIRFEVPISSFKGKVYIPTAFPSGR